MIFDIIIGVVVLLSAVIAFFRGFIRETLTILGVLGGLFAAYTFGDQLAPFYESLMGVQENVPEGEEAERFLGIMSYETLAQILGYATVFIAVVIVLSIISHILSKIVESIGMGLLDRTLGVIFGIARGVILLGVLYAPVHMFVEQEEKESWFEGSRLHVYVELTAEWIIGFFPEDFVKEASNEKADQARETLKNLDILPRSEELMEELKNSIERPSSQAEDTENNKTGYEPEARKSMEELIKEQENSAAGDENER